MCVLSVFVLGYAARAGMWWNDSGVGLEVYELSVVFVVAASECVCADVRKMGVTRGDGRKDE